MILCKHCFSLAPHGLSLHISPRTVRLPQQGHSKARLQPAMGPCQAKPMALPSLCLHPQGAAQFPWLPVPVLGWEGLTIHSMRSEILVSVPGKYWNCGRIPCLSTSQKIRRPNIWAVPGNFWKLQKKQWLSGDNSSLEVGWWWWEIWSSPQGYLKKAHSNLMKQSFRVLDKPTTEVQKHLVLEGSPVMLSMGRLPTGVPMHVLHRAVKGVFDSEFLEVDTQIIIESSVILHFLFLMINQSLILCHQLRASFIWREKERFWEILEAMTVIPYGTLHLGFQQPRMDVPDHRSAHSCRLSLATSLFPPMFFTDSVAHPLQPGHVRHVWGLLAAFRS